MKKLMINDQVDKLNLHGDEVNKQKSLGGKKITGIQKRKLIDTTFAKYLLSENVVMMKHRQPLSNR